MLFVLDINNRFVICWGYWSTTTNVAENGGTRTGSNITFPRAFTKLVRVCITGTKARGLITIHGGNLTHFSTFIINPTSVKMDGGWAYYWIACGC